jgi:hypothetical protein
MTTKPPSSISGAAADSLERLAYSIASEIPARETNDNYRLGYCLWGWLSERRGTLLQAVRAAGVRTTLSPEEAAAVLQKRLEEHGIKIS